VCMRVCVCVNQGGTNHNRCTWRLVILHSQILRWTLITDQQLRQSDVDYCYYWAYRSWVTSWASVPTGSLFL